MNQNSTNKRSAKTIGIKAWIATASVAATLAGWAILPANDPQATAGAASQSAQQPPALSVPGGDDFSQFPGNDQNNNQVVPSSPDNSQSQLPQVQAPQNSSPFPFARSRSSR